MKQVLVKKGKVYVDEIPVPMVSDNGVLVKVLYSAISAGTEMSTVNSSGKSLISKAIEQPEKVKKAINILKNHGTKTLVNKIKGKEYGDLIGYSAAGIVVSTGKNVNDLIVGDKVACAGAGFANHAEYIEVPKNLVAKVPEGVSLELASTTTLGIIALQGVHRADIKMGEYVVVIGLGILGQLTVQMLKASGCIVIGIDIDNRRLNISKECGCDYVMNSISCDINKEVKKITEGYGVDASIITAATESNTILSQAFNICRRKGRVVLVGTVGNEFKREDMYEKELDFVISTSYGPGRYDPNYEEKGQDYPYAYVRWTENRNMKQYLNLLNDGKVNLKSIIEGVYNIEDANNAYEELRNSEKKPLIILLKYSDKIKNYENRIVTIKSNYKKDQGKINIGLIGVGGFAKGMHLPNLERLSDICNIYAVMSRTGTNAKAVGTQYGAKYVTTDYNDILNDKNINMVLISTRHNLHAQMSIEAMKCGKAVFVEKPMALNITELEKVLETIQETKLPYMVGFNRRFSKCAIETKEYIQGRINPLIINYQMNAGYIPLDHWVHNDEGGGRIIGEGCHIFDLFNYFTDSVVESISVNSITPRTKNISLRDNIVTTLRYKDGSICTLTYTSLGNSDYPKEICQIYFDDKIIIIDDYKSIKGYGIKLPSISSKISEKGHYEELIAFSKAINSGDGYPIPVWQLEQATKVSFLIENELCR